MSSGTTGPTPVRPGPCLKRATHAAIPRWRQRTKLTIETIPISAFEMNANASSRHYGPLSMTIISLKRIYPSFISIIPEKCITVGWQYICLFPAPPSLEETSTFFFLIHIRYFLICFLFFIIVIIIIYFASFILHISIISDWFINKYRL